MKLPEGKVKDTLSGGLDALKERVDKIKSENFTGYLLIKKTEDDSEFTGQVVFQDGGAVLSEYLSPKKKISGPPSVIPIIDISLDEKSEIEVHTSIDVDLMIRFFSKAKIKEDDFNIEQKLMELEDLEKKEKEKAEELKKELEKRKELEEKLKTWKDDGYAVKKLEKIFGDDIDKVVAAFEKFEEGVEKLKELDKRLGSIDNDGLKDEVAEIESKLNNPELVDEIESELSNLEQTIEEQSTQREELRKKVNTWKEDGYNVSNLADLIETDVGKAWDDFTTVMDTIQKLKEYEELVNNIKGKAFKDRVDSIQSKVKDVSTIDEIKKEYAELEKLVKEDEKKKEKLKETVEEWKNNGYNVGSILDIFEESSDVIEDKIKEFGKKIKLLDEIKGRIEKLDQIELGDEIRAISEQLNDPDATDELMETVQDLEKKSDEINVKKEGLKSLLENLKNDGYDVIELEEVMGERLEIVMQKFEEFESKKKQLDAIGKELDELSIQDFPEDAEQIKSKLKDIGRIEQVNELLAELKEKIRVNEEERNSIRAQMESLKEEGYNLTRIEALFKENLQTLKEGFQRFLEDVNSSKNLKERLNNLASSGYEDDIKSIQDKLLAMENLPDIENEINALAERITADQEKRNEIKTKFDVWREEGYQLEDIEGKLNGPLSEVESFYSETESNIKKLVDISEQLKSLDTKWHPEEAENIITKLKNPGAILEVEKSMAEFLDILEKEQKQRKELKDQLERWREEGYNVSMLDNIMDQHVTKISETAVQVNESINQLKELEEQLNNLDTKWFEEQAVSIKEKVKDPERIEEVKSELEDLENKIETTKKRRDEFKAKYEDWKDQGFNVDALTDILDKELSQVEQAFEDFEKDLAQLLELQKKMGIKLPSPGKKPEGKEEKEPELRGKPEVEPEKEKEKGKKEKEGEEPEKKPGKEKPAKPKRDEEFEDLIKTGMQLIPEYVFDTFVVGASNRFTHAAALAVAETPAEAYNPLFIYGGVGLGKTHLLNAIGNHVVENHNDLNIVYTTSEKFTNELINSIRFDKIEEFRNIYRTADVLIIDDIQFLAGKESTQEEFFHTFNALINSHKQIVLSSDRPPKDIPQLEERLKSRFEGGLITDIQAPSLETKIIILRREAKKEKIEVPDEVMHLIASKVKSNIRELRGALTKIVAYSKLVKQTLTEELAKEVLKDFISEKGRALPSLEKAAAASEGAKESAPAEDKPISVSDGLSTIEKRLSSLRKKLSPIFKGKKEEKGAEKEKVEASTNPEEASKEKESPTPKKEEKGEPPKPPEGNSTEPSADSPPKKPEKPAKSAEPPAPPTPEAPAGPEAAGAGGAEEGDMAKCGNCGEFVPESALECPNCGVSFANEAYECPMCHEPVTGDSNRCEHCGAEFEIVEEEPKDEEKKKKKKKKK